jgi:hypothetical protein
MDTHGLPGLYHCCVVLLTGQSGTDGFAGTELSLGLGFSYIQFVLCTSSLATDQFRTLNADSIFIIDTANGGTMLRVAIR